MAPGEHDTEHGFGTGLRAQLEKRRETDEPAPESQAPEAPTLPPAAVVAIPSGAAPTFEEVDAIRRELYEALSREQEARTELGDLQARLEQDLAQGQSLSLRS